MELEQVSNTILNNTNIEKIFPHQQKIFDVINASEKNVIYQAPTSSGKTLPATIFCYQQYQDKKKTLYAVPSKAMKDSKKKELLEAYASFEDKPTITTAGSNNTFDGDIFIGTFEEMYSSILRQQAGSSYDNLILDDFHILYDPRRGYTLEKMITYVLAYEQLRIIAMSATIAPIKHISDWLNYAESLSFGDEVRPVTLKKITIRKTIPDLLQINETPCLVFCSTKQSTRSNCEKVASKQKNKNDSNLLIKKHKKDKVDFDKYDLLLLDCMMKGVAFHNSKLDKETKEWVEQCFQDRLIDYLFATTTLAYGVNLPAKSVVIYDILRYNGNCMIPLPKYEWEQMSGRAGRTNLSKEGTVYTAYSNAVHNQIIKNRYYYGKIEDLKSSINEDDHFKKALLDMIEIKKGTEQEITSFFEKAYSYHAVNKPAFGIPFQLDKVIMQHIRQLHDMGYIERRDPSKFILSDFGLITVNFLKKMFDDYNLKALKSLYDSITAYEHIQPDDMLFESLNHAGIDENYSPVWLQMSKCDLKALKNKYGKNYDKPKATFEVLINGWMKGLSNDEIDREYGLWATHIKTLNKKITSLLDFANDICSTNGIIVDGKFDDYRKQVYYGVPLNFVCIAKLKTFGRELTLRIRNYVVSSGESLSFYHRKDTFIDSLKTLNDEELDRFLSAIKNPNHGVPGIGNYRSNLIRKAVEERKKNVIGV